MDNLELSPSCRLHSGKPTRARASGALLSNRINLSPMANHSLATLSRGGAKRRFFYPVFVTSRVLRELIIPQYIATVPPLSSGCPMLQNYMIPDTRPLRQGTDLSTSYRRQSPPPPPTPRPLFVAREGRCCAIRGWLCAPRSALQTTCSLWCKPVRRVYAGERG